MLKFISAGSGLTSVFSKASFLCSARRNLYLHEYQCKKLMQDYNINVQDFGMVESKADLKNIGVDFKEYVVKAQILAGGRGKGTFTDGFAGGVHVTKCKDEATKLAGKMLGNRLVTKQTGGKGVLVQKVMVADAVNIVKETYVAILLDSTTNGPALIGSPMGGMDIEEVVEKSPEALFKIPIDMKTGLTTEAALKMAKFLKFDDSLLDQVAKQFINMYKLFCSVDSTQFEVNPFSLTDDKRIMCVDSKITFDDNAKFRHKEIFDQEDTTQINELELLATKNNLNYVKLDGSIGCIVNGAGLAMATMDMIKYHGGEPANFLDLGGGVSVDGVLAAMDILKKDPNVKTIFINIFGGIVNCATVAQGLVQACQENPNHPRITVRLQGTNCEEARKIIEGSKLPGIEMRSGFQEAAQTACAK